MFNRLSLLRNSCHKSSLYRCSPFIESHSSIADFKSCFLNQLSPGQRLPDVHVSLRGRVSAKRESSKKLVFYTLHKDDSSVQIMCDAKDSKLPFDDMHNNITRGDLVNVIGCPGKSQRGELSVMASSVLVESPCLQNLPLVINSTDHHRRHLDMLVHGSHRLVQRSHILSSIRRHLDQLGFLEVETPILSQKCGGATATPFQTASDPPLFLRIAPELYLKRLLVGGLDAVYEMGKQFRNEGVDKTHVNEFTTLELYRANWDYEMLMSFTQDFFRTLVRQFHPTGTIGNIDFNAPFRVLPMIPTINAQAGCNIPEQLQPHHLPMLKDLCARLNVHVAEPVTVGRCIDKLCGRFVEPLCGDHPTFITDHPRIMSPLAKGHRTKGPLVSERFELFINGVEYVNAYSELNDPQEQLATFQAQVAEGDPESPKSVDHDYVEALTYGLPSCGGWGIGIDRFVMLLTKTQVIDDVIFFPRET